MAISAAVSVLRTSSGGGAGDVSVTVDAVSAAMMAEEPRDELVGVPGDVSARGSVGTAGDREGWNFGPSLDPPVTDEEPTGSYRDAGSVEKDSGSVPAGVKQQRFYFESDSLVLKDNPE